MKNTRRFEAGFEVFRVIAAVIIGYAIALLMLLLISKEPLYVIRQFVFGPFSSIRRLGDVVVLAVPLMFTGLCMCFMYAVNKFNLIAEGTVSLSGCLITWAALSMSGSGIPSVPFIVILLIIAGVVGAACAYIPAVLEKKFNANVCVVSLMLNYVLFYVTQYILNYIIKDNSISFVASKMLPNSARLSTIFSGTEIHAGLIIAVACVVLVAFIFYKTPFGLSMRIVGHNQTFAKYIGINVSLVVILAQVVGGIFAGLGGAVEIMGAFDRFQWTELTNYGFDGLMVAVLARTNPALVPIGAFLLAYIRIGADIVTRTTDIPPEFVSIVQGIIILLVAAEMFLSGIKNKMIYKAAEENLQKDQSKVKA